MKLSNTVDSGQWEKAKLIFEESETIEFMFNPTEISFTQLFTLSYFATAENRNFQLTRLS